MEWIVTATGKTQKSATLSCCIPAAEVKYTDLSAWPLPIVD